MAIITEVADAPADITTPYQMVHGDVFFGEITDASDVDWIILDHVIRDYDYRVTITLVTETGDPIIGETLVEFSVRSGSISLGTVDAVELRINELGDIGPGHYRVSVDAPVLDPLGTYGSSNSIDVDSSGMRLDYDANLDAILAFEGGQSIPLLVPNGNILSFYNSGDRADDGREIEVHSSDMVYGDMYFGNGLRFPAPHTAYRLEFHSADGETHTMNFAEDATVSFNGVIRNERGEIVHRYQDVSGLLNKIQAAFYVDLVGTGDLTFKVSDPEAIGYFGDRQNAVVEFHAGITRDGALTFENGLEVEVYASSNGYLNDWKVVDGVVLDFNWATGVAINVSGQIEAYDDAKVRVDAAFFSSTFDKIRLYDNAALILGNLSPTNASNTFTATSIHLHDTATLSAFTTELRTVLADIFGDDNAQALAFTNLTGDLSLNGGDDNASVSGTMIGMMRMGAGVDTVTITGTLDGDLFADDGNDAITVTGRVTGDIRLGLGDDTLTGGGSDALMVRGHGGVDSITGSSTDDTLLGGKDADSIDGADGADKIRGGDGDDHLFGGLGDDVLKGRQGDDVLFGGDNDDTLTGNVGNDTITGGEGTDHLFGGKGHDTLFGGGGDDTFVGGKGVDVMYGGPAGTDVFLFTARSHLGTTLAQANTIHSFDVGADKVDLSAVDANSIQVGSQSFDVSVGALFSFTAGELLVTNLGPATWLQGDLDGDGTADFVIILDGVTGVTAGDVIV